MAEFLANGSKIAPQEAEMGSRMAATLVFLQKLTGYLARPLVFLDFWLGVKKFAQFGLFIVYFLTKFLPKTLNFQNFRAPFGKEVSGICLNFLKTHLVSLKKHAPGVKKFEILAFYCVFVHQFLAVLE